MTRRAWLVLLVAGCTAWHFPEPAARFAPPQGLGTKLPTSGAWLRPLALRFGAGRDRALAMVQEGPGLDAHLNPVMTTDEHWYFVDPTGVVSDAPAPPMPMNAFWPSELPGVILASGAATPLLLDAQNRWATLPALSGAPELLVQTASGQVFARVGNSVLVLGAGQWHDLTPAVGTLQSGARVYLGPADAVSARLVWVQVRNSASEACTQLVSTSTFTALGAALCKAQGPMSWPLYGDAVNGTVDDFQIVWRQTDEAGFIWHFTDGGWKRGKTITGRSLVATPGQPDALLSTAQLPQSGELYRLHAGEGAGTVYSVGYPLFAECTEPTCTPEQRLFALAHDLKAAWFLTSNAVDATRTVYVTAVPLPVTPPTCTPACAASERCIRATPTSTSCVVDLTLVGAPTQFAATTRLQVTGPDGLTTPPIAVTNSLTGEVLSPDVRLDGRTIVLDLPPNTPVTLTIELPGSSPWSTSFTTTNDNTTADLGNIVIPRGMVLGRSAGSSEVGVDALFQPLLAADGGVEVVRVTEGDGGLDVRTLVGTVAGARLEASPDGRWLLVEEPSALRVLELASLQEATVASSVLSGPWSTAHWSRDGSAVAIDRPTGVSVVSVSTTPRELYAVAGPNSANRAQFLQLSRDGARLLVQQSAGASAVSALGEVPLGTSATSVYLSGDGSKVYSANTLNGVSTLTVQAPTSGAPVTTITTAATAFAVDLDSADLIFTTANGPMHHQLTRYSGTTGTTTQGLTLNGVAAALPRAGALWTDSFAGSISLLFPASSSVARTVNSAAPTSVDWRGRLQRGSSSNTQVISETGELQVGAGPGVFRRDASRRVTTNTLETLLGTSPLSLKNFMPAMSTFTMSAAFTTTGPMQSLGAPCAPFTVPAKRVSVDASTGVATWSTVGDDVVCVW